MSAAKCWVITDPEGRITGLSASPEFTLADLADDESVSLWPLDEAVRAFTSGVRLGEVQP